jgi:hypothetical protein
MQRIPRLALAPLLLLTLGSACISRTIPGDGRVVLFDGNNLDAWHGLVEMPAKQKLTPDELEKAQAAADQRMHEHWSVDGDVLVFDGKGESLVTVSDYGDFELWLDWKIAVKGDSGIYLRGTPQVQIWDNPEGSGGLWNNKKSTNKPLVVADKPVGEWNTFYIRMVGERVSVWLNSKRVVDELILENHWDPSSPVYASGPIELQSHGNPLWFRNIYIREVKR